jgi:hypothetical protein
MFRIPFSLQLEGDDAEEHQLQAYDGYMALAGFAFTLSLVTNFVETGKIRHRGDFPGRGAVKAETTRPGSVIVPYVVELVQNPVVLTIAGGLTLNVASNVLYDLMKRVIGRNLGEEVEAKSPQAAEIIERRGGDVEALVAAVEPSVRQTHSAIGNSSQVINIYGGAHVINKYNADTKRYVTQSVEDEVVREKLFSVASFNANSGHGSVFDFDLGRTVPIKLSKATLRANRAVLSWGLNEYANRTGRNVRLRYTRLLALDGTPKKYIIIEAEIPPA